MSYQNSANTLFRKFVSLGSSKILVLMLIGLNIINTETRVPEESCDRGFLHRRLYSDPRTSPTTPLQTHRCHGRRTLYPSGPLRAPSLRRLLRGGSDDVETRAAPNAPPDPALVRFTICGTELAVPISEINSPFHDAPTPLFAAAAEGEPEAIEALLAGGASPQATDADGDTPLTIAAFNGAPDAALASLVAHGAALGHRNRFGATPLHAAAAAGSAAAARALVRLGADPAAVDASGLTPRAMAEGCGHAGEILDALSPAAPPPPP
jgi:hypothetical protein